MPLVNAMRVAALAMLGVATILGSSVLPVSTAANLVPGSRIGRGLVSITANDLKPAECAGITVTRLVVGSGTINASNANELILGSSGADTIDGRAGDDCILGGGGNDTIQGGAGLDVLLGGPGDDSLDGGGPPGDICYGGPGTNTFTRCESIF